MLDGNNHEEKLEVDNEDNIIKYVLRDSRVKEDPMEDPEPN